LPFALEVFVLVAVVLSEVDTVDVAVVVTVLVAGRVVAVLVAVVESVVKSHLV